MARLMDDVERALPGFMQRPSWVDHSLGALLQDVCLFSGLCILPSLNPQIPKSCSLPICTLSSQPQPHV